MFVGTVTGQKRLHSPPEFRTIGTLEHLEPPLVFNDLNVAKRLNVLNGLNGPVPVWLFPNTATSRPNNLFKIVQYWTAIRFEPA
jgi:hypothetical protein